jgi:hypothetical protein
MKVTLAESWSFGPGVRCFTFFGSVEAPEEEFKKSDLLRLLHRRKPIWEDSEDWGYGLSARAVRGPIPGTAVLSVWTIVGGWKEIGVVFWPLRFVAPGGCAEGLRYGVRRGELPPNACIVERPVHTG